MKLIDGSLESLLQGVSQQAPRDRKPGQHTLQENMFSDVVRGLTRRPPVELAAKLIASTDADPSGWNIFHIYVSDVLYIVMYKANKIRVFNTEGKEQTVNSTTEALTYLTDSPMATITINNKTYMSNTSKVVKMSSDVPSYARGYGLVYLMGGEYGRTYTVTLKSGFDSNGENPTFNQTVSWTTPDGSAPAHGAMIATTYIATQLYNLMEANTTITASYNISRASEVILISPKNSSSIDLQITVEDGAGHNIYGVADYIGDASDLPRYAYPNQIVTIKGIKGSSDDWYVHFYQDTEGFGNDGIWRECTKYGEEYKFDLTTMPHILSYDADTGKFTFAEGEWVERRVGDDDTEPPPSCVGNTINDLAVFQGRLVMATGAAVVMSRTNSYLDLWSKSATTVIDSDPIDVESSVTYGAEMRKLIPHNYDLVIFAKRQQFVIFGRSAITPSNTELVLTTSYEADLSASPVSGGRNVFFCMTYGNYTGVREFYTEANIDANNSDSVTRHVTQYIKGSPTQMVASSNFDTLVIRTDSDDTVMYIYQYVWDGTKRAQTAWSKLIMAQSVKYIFFSENMLYLVQQCDDGLYLGFMNLDRVSDDGCGFQVHLDAKVIDTNIHTQLSKPTWYDATKCSYIQGRGCPNPGMPAKVESIGDTYVVFSEDMGGGSIISGVPYTSKFTPTRPFMRDKNGEPILNGTMHITKYRVAYISSGPFIITIDSPFRDTILVKNTGRTIGGIENTIGSAPISTGNMIIPIRSDPSYGSMTFSCDTYMPMTLSGIEWAGRFVKRGTRV